MKHPFHHTTTPHAPKNIDNIKGSSLFVTRAARAAKNCTDGKYSLPKNHIAKDEIICLWWRLYCRTAMNHGGRRGSASLVWALQCCVAFTYEIKGTSTCCWLAGGNIRDLFNDMSVDDITKETICHNIFFAKPISQSRSMVYINVHPIHTPIHAVHASIGIIHR